MDMEPEVNSNSPNEATELTELKARSPLELLRDTEAIFRSQTVATLAPILPENAAFNLQEASNLADESLKELAKIELDEISDVELQPARILIGLTFVGFGALLIVFLLLYLYTLHPELSPVEQVSQYWYEYIWFVSLGVAGMMMLGREAMRPKNDD
jgi:hypothetical protein